MKMKKSIRAIALTGALALAGTSMASAGQAVTGTVASIEIDEGYAAVTVKTQDGRSLILQLDPAQVTDLKNGDQIQVSTEKTEPKLLKKL